MLRTAFRIVLNTRAVRVYPGCPAAAVAADLAIVRENAVGFFSDCNPCRGHGELMSVENVAITLGVFIRSVARHVTREAFGLPS